MTFSFGCAEPLWPDLLTRRPADRDFDIDLKRILKSS